MLSTFQLNIFDGYNRAKHNKIYNIDLYQLQHIYSKYPHLYQNRQQVKLY